MFTANCKLVTLEYLLSRYSDIVNFTLGFSDAGASEPSLVTQFSPPLSTPVPSIRGQHAEPPFVSFRTFLLVLDDGPEQGGLRNPYAASSENDGGCALGPCVPGSGTQSEAGVTNERKGTNIANAVDEFALVFVQIGSTAPYFLI